MARKAKLRAQEADVADDDQDDVEVEVTAIPAPTQPAPLAPVAPAVTEPQMVPKMVRADPRDQEKRPSIHDLNKLHMERRKAELAARDDAYEKGVLALQKAHGIAPGTPVPVTMASGVNVVPNASPFAQQLLAQNAAAKK